MLAGGSPYLTFYGRTELSNRLKVFEIRHQIKKSVILQLLIASDRSSEIPVQLNCLTEV